MKTMNNLLALFLLALIIACANPIEKVEKAIYQYFEDYAFKNNIEIKTLEISGLTLNEVGENYFDTLKLIDIGRKLARAEKLVSTSTELLDSQTRLLRLYGSLDRGLYQNAKEDVEKTLAKGRLYLDTLKMVTLQDSIIRNRIELRKSDPPKYYKARFLLKLSLGGENLLDTSVFLLNKKLEVLWPDM